MTGQAVTIQLDKEVDVFYNLIESFFAIIYEVHLIDSKYKMMDSHQGTDTAVASCLYQNTLFCIDETLSSVESERTSRIIDSDGGAASMEKRKREGYF